MKQSGRKSAESQSVLAPVEIETRVRAPVDLSEFEASIWNQVVNTKPAEWFGGDTIELLKSYCKHVSQANLIDSQLQCFTPDWLADKEGLDRFDKLNRLRDLNTKQINALSRSMRLTQQAKYDAAKAQRRDAKGGGLTNDGKKPWER